MRNLGNFNLSNVGLKGSHFSVLLLLSQTANWSPSQKNFFQILFFATFHLLALRRNFHQQHVQTSAIACWRNQNMTKIDLFELFLSNQDKWNFWHSGPHVGILEQALVPHVMISFSKQQLVDKTNFTLSTKSATLHGNFVMTDTVISELVPLIQTLESLLWPWPPSGPD